MKSKKNYYAKVMLYLSILVAAIFLKPGNCSAADKDSKLEGIKLLKGNTAYEYDLNGDGKTDTIKFKVTENELEHTATLKLYINNKLCLTKKDDGLSFGIYILDLNKKDNHLDLFIHTTMESDCSKNVFFAQYDGKNIVNKIPLNFDKLAKDISIYRFSLEKTDGAGKITLLVDTPVYSKATGCYLCYISYNVKDNKISMVPADTYTLSKYSREYQYKAVKAFTAFSETDLKKLAFKVKKGDKVTADKIYISKTGNLYFRITDNKGNKGWIDSNQENLFAEFPSWG